MPNSENARIYWDIVLTTQKNFPKIVKPVFDCVKAIKADTRAQEITPREGEEVPDWIMSIMASHAERAVDAGNIEHPFDALVMRETILYLLCYDLGGYDCDDGGGGVSCKC